MAGTIQLSLSQQLDALGAPLAGGKLYLYAAGTTTPQNSYSDTGLTVLMPYPITLDAAGRIPQFFLADGQIKVRLTDKDGVVQFAADYLLVIGASSGGGGGVTVDPTSILSTGDFKAAYGTGALAGFARANGKSAGSSTSGATERANADTQNLFLFLWAANANLAVSGGRGVSAAADWAANKNIELPDARGRTIFGLDDMGNTAAGRLTTAVFGTDPTVLGNAGGAQSQTLTGAMIAAHTHTFSTGTESGSHGHLAPAPASKITGAVVNAGGSAFFWTGDAGVTAATGNESATHTHSGTTDASAAASAAVPTVPPGIVTTIYIKL